MLFVHQVTLNARDVQAYDIITFGNTAYRVYSVGPKDYDASSDRIRIDLISDQQVGPSNKIMIKTELDADHLVTVLRQRK